MRLVARPGQNSADQRREQSRRRRVAAGTLGDSFPDVQQLRIELSFHDPAGPAPTGQVHDVYPPASAVFEAACPHGGCDGVFDLTEVIASLLAQSGPIAQGVQPCFGSHAGLGPDRESCTLSLRYRITAHYAARS